MKSSTFETKSLHSRNSYVLNSKDWVWYMKSLTFEEAGPNKQNKAIVYDIKPGTPHNFQSPLVSLFVCFGKNINLVQPLKNLTGWSEELRFGISFCSKHMR